MNDIDKFAEADETRLLYEEATMSIEALLAKYGRVRLRHDKECMVYSND